MEKVRKEHSGNFTIQGIGQPTPDGRFIATFVVTERLADSELEAKRSTGETFDTEEQAIDAAFEAGKQWLDDYRPANEWEGKS